MKNIKPKDIILTITSVSLFTTTALYWHTNLQLQMDVYATKTELSRYKVKDAIVARYVYEAPVETEKPKEELKKEVVSNVHTPITHIEQMIASVFSENPQEALAIAKCESGLKPDSVGDTNIMSYDATHDEMVGDSIGLFQVRTGGKGWNRARANNMSANEFRTWMSDPESNIKYAKDIYDRAGGWGPWRNCKNKLGL